MACLGEYVYDCYNFIPFPTNHRGGGEDTTDGIDFANRMMWSHDLGAHSAGEFSHAVLKANSNIEDYSHVDTAAGGLFVGVFDGHGGDYAAKFLVEDLFSRFNSLARETHSISETVLRDAFAGSETAFLDIVREQQAEKPDMKSVGSCCLVGVIWGGRLYLANAGDSRVVIGRKSRLGRMHAEQLTSDDNANRLVIRRELRAANPDDQHIVVFTNGSWRVKGLIQVSRSIGDAFLKHNDFSFPIGHQRYIVPPLARPALSPVPNVSARDLRRNDKFLIFASDGLWELISNRRAVEIVHKNPRNGIARKLIREAVKAAAERSRIRFNSLRQVVAGTRRNFHDDISVVVVFLDAQVAGQERPEPDSVHVRSFVDGVLPGRFDINGIN